MRTTNPGALEEEEQEEVERLLGRQGTTRDRGGMYSPMNFLAGRG